MTNSDFLKMLNERPIAYYPIYRKIAGSTTAGILLSQLMYWFSKKDKFFKTDEDIRNETLLTEKELRTAKQKIKKIPFLKVTREGLPAKTYYKIDWDLYAEFMNNFYNENVKNEPTIKNEKDLTSLDEKSNSSLDEKDKHNRTKGTNITYTKTTYTKTTNLDTSKFDLLNEALKNYNIQLLLKELRISELELKSLLEYRKILKKPLKTTQGIIGLLKSIKATMIASKKNYNDIVDIMQENEWLTIKPEYIVKKTNTNSSTFNSNGKNNDIVETNMNEAQRAIEMRRARLKAKGEYNE